MADEKAKIVTDSTGPGSGPAPAQPEAAAQVPKQEQPAPEVPAPEKSEAPAQEAPVPQDKAADAPKEQKAASVSVFNFSEIMAEKKATERAAAQQEVKAPEKAASSAPSKEAGAKQGEQSPKRRGRPPKADKEKTASPGQKEAPSKKDKAAQEPAPAKKPEKAPKATPEVKAPVQAETPATPAEAPRPGKEEQIVYIKLSELHAFKNHPFQVRNDEEMKAMLWECPTLDKSIHIGVEAHSYASPKEVIIDGQQRLTSLYAVMKGKKVINSKFDEKSIIISYCPLQDKFEVGCQATKNDPEWIYNISDLFTTTNSFKFIGDFIRKLGDHRAAKGNALTDEEQGLIAERTNSVFNLKSHTLPIFDIKANAEEEDVSEIFVRVNSGGVSLKQNDFILTLLSLYWDEGRREIERFSKESTTPYKGKTTSYNPLTTVSAQDVIRVVMAYAFDRARLKYGYKLLRGADFDRKGAVDENLRTTRFDILKERLPDVLDVHSWHEFIKAIMNAGYLSGEMILSGNAIFYTYALYLIAKHRFHASYYQSEKSQGF